MQENPETVALKTVQPTASGARGLEWFGRLGERFDQVLVGISGGALFLMMITVTADVALRYLLNAPLIWAHDLVSLYLLGFTIFLGLNAAMRHGDHIAVDLVFNLLPGRTRAMASLIIYLVASLVFAVFFWVTLNATWVSFVRDEQISGLIAWSIWPSNLPAPIGFAAVLMTCLYRALRTLLELVGVLRPVGETK